MAVMILALVSCTHEPAPPPAPQPELDPATRLRVHFIDVGQGDAVLFEFPCAAALVDLGGEVGDGVDGVATLRAYLIAFFDRRPDLNRTLALVAITHPGLGHVRGASLLLHADAQFKVANVVTLGREASAGSEQIKQFKLWAEAEQIPMEQLELKDVSPLKGYTSPVVDPVRCAAVDPVIRVLYSGPDRQPHDWERRDFESLDNRSMVLRVDFGETSALLLSDLGKTGRSVLLSTMVGSGLLAADILKVAGHGVVTGTTGELLGEISPEVAVISVGGTSRRGPASAFALGLPAMGTVNRLLAAVRGRRTPAVEVPVAVRPEQFEMLRVDRAIYATGWDGTVVLEAAAKGKVRRWRP
jgi:competence protein ComEC